MPRHDQDTSADLLDPSPDAGDAVGTALRSADRPASDIIPAVGHFMSRTVYTTSYAVSYGVVFPAALIARAVPRENALVEGVVDGARAARDRVLGWHEAGWDDGHEEIAEHGDGHEQDEAEESGGRRRRGRRKTSH